MAQITREEVVRKWKAARQQKREITAREIQRLSERYERETGEKPKYIEAW